MEWRVGVSGINQKIGVDQKHLLFFHDAIELVPIGRIHVHSAAVECRKRRQFLRLLLRAKQVAQRSLDQLGHGPPLPRGFLLQPRHHSIVDVQCGLHMENHMHDMAVCQSASDRNRSPSRWPRPRAAIRRPPRRQRKALPAPSEAAEECCEIASSAGYLFFPKRSSLPGVAQPNESSAKRVPATHAHQWNQIVRFRGAATESQSLFSRLRFSRPHADRNVLTALRDSSSKRASAMMRSKALRKAATSKISVSSLI